MARLSDSQIRFLLAALALIVGAYQARYLVELYGRLFQPQQTVRSPFYYATPPQVKSVWPEAYRAGVRIGERVTRINGEPVTGSTTLGRRIPYAHPGDVLTLTLQDASGAERDTTVTLHSEDPPGTLWLDVFLQGFMPVFCILLGFWIAFMRPHDARAWIMLGLMVSFSMFFVTRVDVFMWNSPLRQIGVLVRGGGVMAWGVWMLLLGMHFPERLPLSPRLLWAVRLVALPLIVTALLQIATEFGRMENPSLAIALSPLLEPLQSAFQLLTMISVGWYFACLGRQWAIAQSPNAKRRAILLNFGSHLSFLPMFILVLRAMISGRFIYDGVPWGVVLFSVLCLSLFPLTLAYIIVVHRAMGMRVALRTGLQYALARRGVFVMRIIISAAAVYYATIAATKPGNQIVGGALAILAIVLLARLSRRVMNWTDRRFFREAYQAETILSELGEEVRSVVETRPLLDVVVKRIAAALHVPRVVALLREGEVFQPVVAAGYPSLPDIALPASSALIRRVRQNAHPLIVNIDDPNSWARKDPRHAEEQASLEQLRSHLLVPLPSKQGLAGIISLGPKLSEEPYSATDLHLLRSVAVQTGLALENGKLTESVAHQMAQREQLDREMAITREVQQRLFPHKLPAVEGLEYTGACRPAQSVGGDYYDFLELPDCAFGFAVGDVSGKGMPAALLMSALQASVRGQAMNGITDLAIFMRNVNRLLYDMSPKSHFATLFYGIFDPGTGRMRYASGGHNPPILLRASGTVEFLAPTGPGVGITKLGQYRQAETQLEPGDLLVAFTDGFTEAMNEQREEFGEQRLVEAIQQASRLAPDAILAHTMSAVDNFSAGAMQHDDMTMVVLKVMVR